MSKTHEHEIALRDLFSEIEESHAFELTEHPHEIDNFEKVLGYKLPEDLKGFYRRYKTVQLFPYNGGWHYRFVPINEIHMTGLDIFGEDYDKDSVFSKESTYSWFTICDAMDGNYVAVDLESGKDNQWNYIDCDHETYGIPGECKVIAKSFMEFMRQCLQNKETHFYLEKGFQGYGDALEITSKTAIRRIHPVKPKWGWIGEIIRQMKYPQIQSGWYVEFVKLNKSYNKFFSDKMYGSKEKAFEAADSYLEKTKDE